MTLTSLDTARKAGLTRYFTGKPCKHGHVAERLVSNRRCTICSVESSTAWKKEHRSQATSSSKVWRDSNREHVREVKRIWNTAHPEWQKARSRKWFLANKDRANQQHYAWVARNPEVARNLIDSWIKANPSKRAATTAKRRAALLSRTPVWSDLNAIEEIYRDASEFRAAGLAVDVDHIIPLQGRLVSGLHVPANLRVLLSAANRSKSNHFRI